MKPNTDSSRAEREAAHFDKLAEDENRAWWGAHTPAAKYRYEERVNWMIKEIGPSAAKSVLEIGCADGVFTKTLAERLDRGCAIKGIDISVRQAALARQRCTGISNVSFDVVDATDTRFTASSYDNIVGFACLHHLNVEPALIEFRRLLKPGGKILFAEPNMLNPQIWMEKNIKFIGRWLQNSPDETAFVRWSLERLLKKLEYKDINIIPFDFLHPGLPERLLPFMLKFNRFLSRMPILKEIGGSLLIAAGV